MKRLVYGVVPREPAGNLVFLPEEEAFRLASIHYALQTSVTWGDFRDRMPPDDYEQLLEAVDERGIHHEPHAEFLADHVPGYYDGFFPDWPEQRMLQWLPEHVIRRFGRIESTLHDGVFLRFDVGNELAIVEELQSLGYECRHDEPFVQCACGCSHQMAKKS